MKYKNWLIIKKLICVLLCLLVIGQTIYIPLANCDNAFVIIKVAGEEPRQGPQLVTDLFAGPGFITGLPPEDNGAGRIKLIWTAPPDLPNNDKVFSYTIKYATFSIYDLGGDTTFWWMHSGVKTIQSDNIPDWWGGIEAQQQPGNQEQKIISGLEPGRYYYFSIKSIDKYYNKSDIDLYSKTVSSQAKAMASTSRVPPGKITTLIAQPNYSKVFSVKLSWITPGNDYYENKIIQGNYRICYSTVQPPEFSFEDNYNPEPKWNFAKSVYISTSNVKPGEIQSTIVDGLYENTSYYFKIWVSDEWYLIDKSTFNWNIESNLAISKPSITEPPEQVKNLTIEHYASDILEKGSYVKFIWTNPSSVYLDGVKICQSTYTYPLINEGIVYDIKDMLPDKTTTYYIYQLKPRTSYYYSVFTYDEFTQVSSPVFTWIYTQKDIIPPDPVTDLISIADASFENGSYINLSWINPDKLLYQNQDWEKTKLYISTNFINAENDNQAIIKEFSTDTTSYIYNFLQRQTTYYFAICNIDGGNNISLFTRTFSYTLKDVIPPDKVSNLTCLVFGSTDIQKGTYIELSWINPQDIDLKGIKIYYSTYTTVNSTFTELNFVELTDKNVLKPGIKNKYYFYQLKPRTSYYYSVFTYDNTELYSTGSFANGYTHIDLIRPDKITDLTCLSDAGTGDGCYIQLNWINPDRVLYQNNDWIETKIYVSTISQTAQYNSMFVQELSIDTTYYRFTQLQPQTTYYFAIVTIDDYNLSVDSFSYVYISGYTLKDIIPPGPLNIVKVITGYDENIDIGGYINLEWTAPKDKDLNRIDIEVNEINYITDKIYTKLSKTINKPLPYQKDSLLITGLLCNVTYYFSFILSDFSNNITTNTFNYIIPVSKDKNIPMLPLGINFRRNENNTATIFWNPVKNYIDARPFAVPPKSIEIYKYLVMSCSDTINSSWFVLDILNPDVTSYTLTLKENYRFFKIRAMNITGNYSDSYIIDILSSLYVNSEDGSYLEIPEQIKSKLTDKNILIKFNRNNSEEKGSILKSFNIEFYELLQDKLNKLDNFAFDRTDANLYIKYDIEKIKSGNRSLSLNQLQNIEDNLSIFYYNGLRWLKVNTLIDKDNKLAKTKFKIIGLYQLRISATPTEFTFYNVMPKIITPNNDGQNDRLLFNYANPKNIDVTIKIFDIQGCIVKDLGTSNETSNEIGNFRYWDGTDQNNQIVPPGVYIYQLETEGKVINGTIVVAR